MDYNHRHPVIMHPDHHHHEQDCHTNAFLDLDGIPYLLGEYLDKTQFRQLDRSLIKSEITVDQSEAMRTFVNISIDDIGRRADGLPNVAGNSTKYNRFIKSTYQNAGRLKNQFDILRKGLIITVEYQLENQRTHQVIRSAKEDLRIPNRSYFLDINPRDIDDNAIVVNFSNSMISTINQFTHGTDRMLIRITGIKLAYECLKRDNLRRTPKYATMWTPDSYPLPDYDDDFNSYDHHKQYQNRHRIDIHGRCNCDDHNVCDDNGNIYPPNWMMFNRFYRFDNEGRDVILHDQEIYDQNNRIFKLPCGSVVINRMFMVNPGHRIVFNLSVWKNDTIVVNNAQDVAKAIGAQCLTNSWDYHYPPKPPVNPDMETIIRILKENVKADEVQDKKLRRIWKTVQDMQSGITPPPDPDPDDDCEPLSRQEILDILNSL